MKSLGRPNLLKVLCRARIPLVSIHTQRHRIIFILLSEILRRLDLPEPLKISSEAVKRFGRVMRETIVKVRWWTFMLEQFTD